jgi:hypothetical protein
MIGVGKLSGLTNAEIGFWSKIGAVYISRGHPS